MMAGPLMQRILRRKKRKRFTAFVGARSFIPELKAQDRFSAILELVPVSGAQGAEMNAISDAVIERERVIPTGLGNGIALPHARIKGLVASQIAMGISRKGIDFDAPDGEPARIICVILTPAEDQNTALELYRDIIATFKDPNFRDRALQVKNYTELLALLASSTAPNPGEATIAPAHG
jgi:mannitol/fructose-specific phosphotransferase system IIA component (Ntr-type)